jgi:hypothetical protein
MDALTQAYQSELKKTRLFVADRVGEMFKGLPNYYDEQIPGFLDEALPIVRAGQERSIALTAAYAANVLNVSPVGVDTPRIIESLRGGVSSADVYARPFVTVRSAIYSVGIAAAVIKGANRMMGTATMDVQMASRDALGPLASALGQRVTGWTRVADPNCCDFCIELDGITTGVDEPQPLHNNCGCTATPEVQGLGVASLAVGTIIAATAIREHGELGPVIAAKDDGFTSLDDFTKRQRRQYEAELAQEI